MWQKTKFTYIWLLLTLWLKLNLYSKQTPGCNLFLHNCQSNDIGTDYRRVSDYMKTKCTAAGFVHSPGPAQSSPVWGREALGAQAAPRWPRSIPGPAVEPESLSASYQTVRSLVSEGTWVWDAEPQHRASPHSAHQRWSRTLTCRLCMNTLPQRKKQTSKRAKFCSSVSFALCSHLSGQLTTDTLDFRGLATSINQYLAQSDIEMSNKWLALIFSFCVKFTLQMMGLLISRYLVRFYRSVVLLPEQGPHHFITP